MGLDDTVSEEQPQETIDLVQQVANRHLAAAVIMSARQVRLSPLLQAKVAVPYNLTARWFGPFVVLKAKGAQVTLGLTAAFGEAGN